MDQLDLYPDVLLDIILQYHKPVCNVVFPDPNYCVHTMQYFDRVNANCKWSQEPLSCENCGIETKKTKWCSNNCRNTWHKFYYSLTCSCPKNTNYFF